MANELGTKKWLHVIGLDADLKAIPDLSDAKLIVGGERHLEAVKSQNNDAKLMTWKSPLADTIDDILAYRGQKTVVLATGDPQYFGIGVTLSNHIPVEEMLIDPARSAFSLAASRMGWNLALTECLTLHGRPLENLLSYLQPRAKLFILSHDKTTPKLVAKILQDQGFGDATLHVLENMGAENERQRSAKAKTFDLDDIDDLNTIAIELPDLPNVFLSRFSALPDEDFFHDGQLTKQEVRATTLAALKPFSGAMLWDVGAGCGSVAIEWMRLSPTMKAIAFEQNEKRLEIIFKNKQKLGVPLLKIIRGNAQENFTNLSSPDAIFIGGGITQEGLFDDCYKALKLGGILVANIVTMESETKLFELYNQYGGKLTKLSISRAKPIGKFTGWDLLMPVTQLTITKESD